jgi:hypothetical protein
VLDGEVADLLADLALVRLQQRDHSEAPLREALVVGQRVAEVADPDDRHRPVLLEPKLAPDLVDQVLDVVADPTGAVGAEIRQILANLGGIDAGRLGELLGGHRVRPSLGHVDQAAKVDGQPRHGGFGNAAISHVDSNPHCSNLGRSSPSQIVLSLGPCDGLLKRSNAHGGAP